jgi:hypothetical protein
MPRESFQWTLEAFKMRRLEVADRIGDLDEKVAVRCHSSLSTVIRAAALADRASPELSDEHRHRTVAGK